MPWLARRGDGIVAPHNVSDSPSDLYCRECGESMHVRQSYERDDGTFVAKHFVHDARTGDETASCGSGESDTHKRMKAIAISKVRHVFEDLVDDVTLEAAIGSKYADVLVTFSDSLDGSDDVVPRGALGDTLAIEVQYRNEDKDHQEATKEHLTHGHSVLWLWETQFDDADVDLFDTPADKPGFVPLYPGVTRIQDGYPKYWVTPPLDGAVAPAQLAVSVPAAFPVEWFREMLQQHLVTSATPQYERIATLFPERAERFKMLVEEAASDPDACIDRIEQRVVEGVSTIDRVCGNCTHARDDDYRDDPDALVCWENTPDETNRPRKVDSDDQFAGSCRNFQPPVRMRVERTEEVTGLPGTLGNAAITGNFTPERRRRFALRTAFYLTWAEAEWMHPFSKAREARLAETLGVDVESIPEVIGNGVADKENATDDRDINSIASNSVRPSTSNGQTGLDEFL